MTEKQARIEKRTAKEGIHEVRITLEFSIKLLEDYQSDLKGELKEIGKTIRSAKAKLRRLDEKLKVI